MNQRREYWDPPKDGVSPGKLAYEVQRKAATKLAKDDPDAKSVARSSNHARYRQWMHYARIASDLAGLEEIPLSLIHHAESIRVAGIDERVASLDPVSRMLMAVAGLPDPDTYQRRPAKTDGTGSLDDPEPDFD